MLSPPTSLVARSALVPSVRAMAPVMTTEDVDNVVLLGDVAALLAYSTVQAVVPTAIRTEALPQQEMCRC
jgi:hypothetical protein